MRRIIPLTFFIICPILITGCGSDIPGSDEATQVAAVVTSVNDAAGSETMFKEIFVGGTAPEGREQYFSAIIEINGTPDINGEEATVKVNISQGASEEEGRGAMENEKITSGAVTWTLQKQGETWKIKDAPLP